MYVLCCVCTYVLCCVCTYMCAVLCMYIRVCCAVYVHTCLLCCVCTYMFAVLCRYIRTCVLCCVNIAYILSACLHTYQSVYRLCPHTLYHCAYCRSELDLIREQLAVQHSRILSLQRDNTEEETLCQERLAEQQLRVRQVSSHQEGGACNVNSAGIC